MSQIVFLIDADTTHILADAARGIEPSIEIHQVGEPGMPSRRAKDPEILEFAENSKMMVVTSDKSTMPGHIDDHLSAGHHTWGVVIIASNYYSPRQIAEELVLIWACSTPDEWIDKKDFLPL